jgi:hypothetical protein
VALVKPKTPTMKNAAIASAFDMLNLPIADMASTHSVKTRGFVSAA